ncbi:hypothetical protein ENFA111860_03655 [Enterococcus faecalis]
MSWGGTEKSDELFKQLGIHWIDWNAMVGDAEPLDRQPTTVAEMLAFHQHSLEVYPDYNIRVVLMHDSVDTVFFILLINNFFHNILYFIKVILNSYYCNLFNASDSLYKLFISNI